MNCRSLREFRGLATLTLAAVSSVFILAACAGDVGPAGENGPMGPQGPIGQGCTVAVKDGVKTITCADGTTVTVKDGENGDVGEKGPPGETITTGLVEGTISGVYPDASAEPAQGVTVQANWNDPSATATTDASGKFAMTLPVGVYKLTLSGTGFETKELPEMIFVRAGANAKTTVTATLNRTSALKVAAVALQQVGFGKQVELGATVSGASGTPTYSWKQTGGPTTVALSSTTEAKPTFTTGSFDAIAAAKMATPIVRANRGGWLGITTQQTKDMTYKFEVTVTDGKFSAKAIATVIPAAVTTGLANQPKGVMVIANDAQPTQATTYDWELTAKPTGSTAVLGGATTRNPFFIPDVTTTKSGTTLLAYVLTNKAATPNTTLTLTVGNWGGLTDSCTGCHNQPGNRADAMTALWQNTGHAKLFKEEINGAEGDHYSQVCISCHTVGYNTAPEASNNGFDDVAAAKGWKFPNPPKAGEYDKLPSELQPLAAISCENCHGPAASHRGSGLLTQGSMDAHVCGTCHDSMTHHDRYSLWQGTAHANLDAAMTESSIETRAASAGHCGRCHSAGGFVAYVAKLKANDITNIAIPTTTDTAKCLPGTTTTPCIDVTEAAKLGLTKSTVQPITCQACHEPHSDKLRVHLAENESLRLPSGFSITGGGSGALCMACHNSRNGLRNDANPPTSFSAPHSAAQADVFNGQNAFFVTVGQLSGHGALENSCVSCHVELVPASVKAWNTNHTFATDRSICANCHGKGVTGAMQAAQFEAGLAKIASRFGDGLKKVVTPLAAGGYKVKAWNPVTDETTAAAISIDQVPTKVELIEIHGAIAVTVTYANDVSLPWAAATVNSKVVSYLVSNLTNSTGTALFTANSVPVKALWNYFLLHSDGSEGAHNPSFATDVIAKTTAQLDTWVNGLP